MHHILTCGGLAVLLLALAIVGAAIQGPVSAMSENCQDIFHPAQKAMCTQLQQAAQ